MQEEENKVLKLSDDAILMVRELIQLSLLTGTNIIDHFRAMRLEADPVSGYITVTKEYIKGYNEMVEKMNAEALELQEKAQATLVSNDG